VSFPGDKIAATYVIRALKKSKVVNLLADVPFSNVAAPDLIRYGFVATEGR
jgi:hypothetical protein